MRPIGSIYERVVRDSMIQYLPNIYKDSKVVNEIIRVDSEEIENLNFDVIDVMNQLYVETATWGLSMWEKICGIPVDPLGRTDEQRRSVIKSKLRGVGVVNKALLKNISESFLNGEVDITEYNKNLLPKFSSNNWNLHENTRMKQANYVGKVSGSTVANPHISKNTATATLTSPLVAWFAEETDTQYTNISTLNGTIAGHSNSTNGNLMQQLFSFNLIEHVIRNYGSSVFGIAVTTAERVAWLKLNVTKMTCNWHGYGSYPAGNKATVLAWKASTSQWQWGVPSTASTVVKVSNPHVNNANGLVSDYIDANGFIHYLAHADASNGTIASTINTDFVELEVYMAAGSIPQADYDLTLNATAVTQDSLCYVPVISGLTYTVKVGNGGNANAVGRLYKTQISVHDSAKQIGTTIDATTTFTVDSTYNGFVTIRLTSGAVGTFTFSNQMLYMYNKGDNLLGDDGSGQSLSSFTLTGSVELSSTQRKSGSTSFKVTCSNSASNIRKDYTYKLDSTKQYLLGCWVYIESYTSGSISINLRDVGTTTLRYVAGANTLNVGSWQFVYVKVPTNNALVGDGFRLYINHGTASTFVAYFDEVRLYEVDTDAYTKIDIDPEWTGLNLEDRLPYVEPVFEATRNYEIGITFIGKRGIPDDLPGIEKAINDVIPAHLAINFIITYLSFDELELQNITWTTVDTYTWDILETAFL